ncbi:MAG: ABC transporter permease [Clostridia bacterium]|nr:ABC transporter permease [Clostridia bacterium]MBR0216983.1 ABC transporter permease [Clostridia bacterium]
MKMTTTAQAPARSRGRSREDRARSFRRFFRTMFSRKIVIAGFVGTLFFVLVALFAPIIAQQDPNALTMDGRLQPASAKHWFGTDYIGRDLFARVVYGTRVSLLTGVISVLLSAFIGVFLGMCAAYFGGVVDKLLLGFCETFNSIPGIALCLTLVSLFGGGLWNMALILCITGIPGFLRMMRASSLSIMSSDYILAERLAGQSKLKIMYSHILPNAISPIIVMSTQMIGATVMMESGLSFLGVGISIPMASWGSIISEARPFLLLSPGYVMIPCVCLALLIISLNLLGDGIRDALDPALRGES